MKKTTWIGPTTLARFSRIMELAGHRGYHTTDGAYVLNLITFYPHDRDLVMAALDQATNPRVDDNELMAPDELDIRTAPELAS